MKFKLTLLAITLLVLSTHVNAQKIRIGLNAGLSICNQNFINPFQEKTSVFYDDGSFFFTGGVFGQYSFTKKFALMLDLNFQKKGLTYRETYEVLGTSGKMHKGESFINNQLNYFQIDLLPKYYIGKRKFKIVVSGGPYIAFLMSTYQYGSYSYGVNEVPNVGNGRLEKDTDGTSKVVGREEDIIALYKPLDMGVQAGLGFEVGRLGFGYRFVYGLNNVYKDIAFYEGSNYSHTLKLSFAFLHLGKEKAKEEGQ